MRNERKINKRGSRLARTVVLLLAFGWCASAYAANNPEVLCEVDPNDIFLGESATYLGQLKNAENPIAPDLADLAADVAVKSLGDQSQNQSMINIVNGQMYQQVVYSHIYQYELTPKRAGTLTIPAPSVTVEGKKVSGPSK